MKFKLFGVTWDFTEIILWVRVITNPNYWIQTDSYNRVWDKMLRAELKNPIFESKDEYTIKLNGRMIWIANYPYGYGSDYGWPKISVGLPSRRTRILLRTAINNNNNYASTKNVVNLRG